MMKKNVPLVLFFLLIFHLNLAAQVRTLAKRYNPVFVQGNLPGIENIQIRDWCVFRFDAAAQTWQPVPFQFDEIDENGNFLQENDGTLDANDLLLFMPDDAGDRAPPDFWPENAAAEQRFELLIFDRNNPDEKAWIYLYKNVAGYNNSPGYFRYLPALNEPAADTVQTRSYKLGHNLKGWTDFVSLSGNRRKNLIDRLKFHVNGGDGIAIKKTFLNEDSLNFVTDEFILRPVRSFQKVKTRIKLQVPPFPSIDKTDTFFFSFFPYSTEIRAGFSVDAGTKFLLVLLKLQNIRLSIDLNPALKNMRFYSSNNRNGFLIDGIPDPLNYPLPDTTQNNWVMASGEDGTILAFFNFPAVQGDRGKFIYYRDNLHGGTNEGTPETGDAVSYGDMGLWLNGEAIVPVENSLTLSFKIYYIDEKHKDAAFAEKLREEIEMPLTVEATLQSKPTDVTEEKQNVPVDFYLDEAYPNPFRPGREYLIFRFKVASEKRPAVLIICDIQGRTVRSFDVLSRQHKPGQTELFWDGRDRNGNLLPAGVYFYRLAVKSHFRAKKLLLIH